MCGVEAGGVVGGLGLGGMSGKEVLRMSGRGVWPVICELGATNPEAHLDATELKLLPED